PNPRRFVVITIDDGYADNLTHALPVFERHAMPFTVYIATCMVTREMDFWWAALQQMFVANEVVEVAPMARRFESRTLEEKVAACAAVTGWVHGDIPGRAPQLRPVFAAHGVDPEALLDQQALTPDQLRRLAAHPLVTIGAHTTWHRELAKLDLA